MSKYLIVGKKFSDGHSEFYPQSKGWFFWHNFTHYAYFEFEVDLCCSTMEEAEKVIARHKKRNDLPVEVARNIYQA